MSRAAAVALALLAGACIPSQGPLMDPGRDCMECHDGGRAKAWTAAGTVYQTPTSGVDAGVEGVRVTLSDADGRDVTLRSNAAGNFYTREDLRFPLRSARVEKGGVVQEMIDVPHGRCNACHQSPPPAPSPLVSRVPVGRVALVGGSVGSPLMNPGQDCVACHLREGGPAYSAAGTVFASAGSPPTGGVAGVTVRFRSNGAVVRELTSNAAGNFFTSDPLPFPVTVEIQQGATVRRMEPLLGTGDGSCNRCHVPGGEAEGRVSLGGGGGE